MSQESAAIHTEALTKVFGSVTALADLTMTVPRGEIFGFLGPNGAGKTTAVKLLVGLSQASSGDAWVLGRPAGDRAARAHIGYLPELFRYQGWLSAYEVLKLHCELAGIPAHRRQREVEEALVTVGLADRAHDRVATFSKGMQQRLGLGVALLGSPDLVFLDEPTSALDPVGRRDVRGIIRELKGRGITVFLNSHLLSEVEQVCDRVAVVERGTVVASGTMAELLGATGVRIGIKQIPEGALEALARFGEPIFKDGWLTMGGVPAEQVPEIVARLVEAGGQVSAVEPGHRTLEERFMELLGDR